MPNPFTSVEKVENDVRRNVWDWSHVNNFTTEIGKITPVFCERVPAGTSLSINARYAMQFMPMMFPIQNHIKARISFFKMPVRALWKNYRDWISTVNQTDSTGADVNSKIIPPYISFSSQDEEFASRFHDYFGTCSLSDYFGLPTEISVGSTPTYYGSPSCTHLTPSFAVGTLIPIACENDPITSPSRICWSFEDSLDYLSVNLANYQIKIPASAFSGEVLVSMYVFAVDPDNRVVAVQSSSSRSLSTFLNSDEDSYVFDFTPAPFGVNKPSCRICFGLNFTAVQDKSFSFNPTVRPSYIAVTQTRKEFNISTCPWCNTDTGVGLKISSLPWRMYEAVYNAFYRNNRNNPLIINGLKRYNTWTSVYDFDGDDTRNVRKNRYDGEFSSEDYFYGFKYINWEPDEFTTAVQSPQEGIAPLVGLTTYTVPNPTSAPSLVNQITDEDGQTYNVKLTSDENGLTGVEYSKTDVLSDGTPVTSVYSAVTQGISISDFRIVNAYQRYLELNMRRGYSYKDIIEGRYDVNVRFSDLLLPEFLGGFTREIGINPITQTTPTNESGTYQGALGSQAGQAFISGSSDNNITCFCDEDSYIMGLVTISPDSIYSQSLPKHFLIRNPLDIFSPEYANIGFQPITMAEFAPLQANAFGGSLELNKTFGYQRPWADLIHKHNSAHGLFRTQLRNFLMNRLFSGIPRLSKQFFLVKPDQVNNVFSVTETTDKIFGQVYFDIRCKNGVPRNNLPRLE